MSLPIARILVKGFPSAATIIYVHVQFLRLCQSFFEYRPVGLPESVPLASFHKASGNEPLMVRFVASHIVFLPWFEIVPLGGRTDVDEKSEDSNVVNQTVGMLSSSLLDRLLRRFQPVQWMFWSNYIHRWVDVEEKHPKTSYGARHMLSVLTVPWPIQRHKRLILGKWLHRKKA